MTKTKMEDEDYLTKQPYKNILELLYLIKVTRPFDLRKKGLGQGQILYFLMDNKRLKEYQNEDQQLMHKAFFKQYFTNDEINFYQNEGFKDTRLLRPQGLNAALNRLWEKNLINSDKEKSNRTYFVTEKYSSLKKLLEEKDRLKKWDFNYFQHSGTILWYTSDFNKLKTLGDVFLIKENGERILNHDDWSLAGFSIDTLKKFTEEEKVLLRDRILKIKNYLMDIAMLESKYRDGKSLKNHGIGFYYHGYRQ